MNNLNVAKIQLNGSPTKYMMEPI